MAVKPIAVGDLVMVVKPTECCGVFSPKAHIFVVARIKPSYWRCVHCGRSGFGESMAWLDDNTQCFAVFRLKRIPPISELEGVQSEEKLKEPA